VKILPIFFDLQLAGWVPEQRHASFAEPLQQAFIEKDCHDGVMASIKR